MAATTLPPADPENLVLARLREIRDTLGNVRDEQDEQRARLSAIEHTLAQEFAHTRLEFARLDARLDRIHTRLGRIERRLDHPRESGGPRRPAGSSERWN
jgi:chromosome segregation ATPase